MNQITRRQLFQGFIALGLAKGLSLPVGMEPLRPKLPYMVIRCDNLRLFTVYYALGQDDGSIVSSKNIWKVEGYRGKQPALPPGQYEAKVVSVNLIEGPKV